MPSPNEMPSEERSSVAQFRTTHWSAVLVAGDTAIPGARDTLESLCRTYWPPLYAFVRRLGHAPADAQDLTQGFFAQLLQSGLISKADPQAGRFRSFLLASLKHFVACSPRRSRTLSIGPKHGPHLYVSSL